MTELLCVIAQGPPLTNWPFMSCQGAEGHGFWGSIIILHRGLRMINPALIQLWFCFILKGSFNCLIFLYLKSFYWDNSVMVFFQSLELKKKSYLIFESQNVELLAHIPAQLTQYIVSVRNMCLKVLRNLKKIIWHFKINIWRLFYYAQSSLQIKYYYYLFNWNLEVIITLTFIFGNK